MINLFSENSKKSSQKNNNFSINLQNKNKNKHLFPLGISVETKHVYPKVPRKEILYDITYPSFQKKVDVKHLKSGKIKITWTLNPPKTKKPHMKKKEKENHSECTKRMIKDLNSRHNMNNKQKLKHIKEKCKLY